MLLFLLVFVQIVTVLAFVIALVARLWVLRIEPVTLRGIDVERATDLVAVYVQGVHDHRFAFPTGVFLIESNETRPGKVVAREANFKGSVGFGLIGYAVLLPRMGAAIGSSFGLFGLIAGGMAGLMLSVIFIGPIIFVAAVEVVLRTLMRSRIEASIAPAPGQADAVTVEFELRGMSAFGVEDALRRGMSPGLPARYRAAAGVAASEAAVEPRRNRLQVIYAAGGATAALLALVVAVSIPGSSADGTSFANPSSSPAEIQPSGVEPEAPSTDDTVTDPAPASDSAVPGADSSTTTPDGTATPPRPMSQADMMKRVVRQHWYGRQRGDDASLRLAYGRYTPAMQKVAGARWRWIAQMKRDAPLDVEVTAADARLVGRGRGVVRASVTTDDDTGCHQWHLTYRMRRINGRWRISDSEEPGRFGC
jgi:hypothetical protein